MTQKGYKSLLAIVDSFTKWVEAFPTKNNTVVTTAKVLVNQVIPRGGIPLEMEAD